MIKNLVDVSNMNYFNDFVIKKFSPNLNDAKKNIELLCNNDNFKLLSDRDIMFLINTCDILYNNIEIIIKDNEYLENCNKYVLNLIKNFINVDEINQNVESNAYDISQNNDEVYSDVVKSYLKQLPNKVLSFEELVLLFKKMQQGDKLAREKIIYYNLRMVISVAKKYINKGLDFEDLIQAGNEGLLVAADKYNYKLGISFSTYASYWIRQAITRSLANNSRTVRLPLHMHENILRIKSFRSAYYNKNGVMPTSYCISENLDLTLETVNNLMPFINGITSLNDKIITDEEKETEIEEFVKSDIDIEKDLIDRENIEEFKNYVFNKLSLSERDKMIIAYRFGFINDKKYTLDEIGNTFNITKERVRQIENRILNNLKRNPIVKRYYKN